ncbi:MAG: hypothetical protein IJC00_06195, partial [Clostridia bacterium]|nr:hypothetical protein [Clostridia bacterium]
MNRRLGRFGLQEGTAAVGLGALLSGTFAVNLGDTYGAGNVCYAATAAGALLSLLLMGLLLKSMERYIFVEADYVPVALYLLPVLLLLVLRGMECVARMAKLLAIPGAVALIMTLYLASPAFHIHHLYPLFSPGFSAFLTQTGEALFRFLPAGTALCVAGKGCQGQGHLSGSVRRGLLLGGVGSTAMQLGLGLTFFGPDIAGMAAPIFCMTMAARQERMSLRLDMLVLFLWLMAGLVAAGFYVYAAALLLCQTAGIQDIRPVGGLLVLGAIGMLLLCNFDSERILNVVRLVYHGGWLLF